MVLDFLDTWTVKVTSVGQDGLGLLIQVALHCFEHGAIEEGALTAFNIALEQFHNAVADRKALLVNLPQNLQRAGSQLRATGTL